MDRAAVRKFSRTEFRGWREDEEQGILFGDVLDEREAAPMDVTFIRWKAGEDGAFDFPLPYDEVFVVTKGSFTVLTAEGEFTAGEGEILYLVAGTIGVYRSDTDAEIVAITCPPYRQALRDAGHGGALEALREHEP
jgi:ethanolamine utilization protein EutQ (cupin superfamily)